MTGITKIEEFNNFFVNEYKYLLGFSKSIDPRNDYESLLHNCYLKIYQRIALSGYSGSTYLNFMRCTIMNTFKTNYRDKKHTIDAEDLHVVNEVEDYLRDQEDYLDQQKENDEKNQIINTYVYEYVQKYYSPQENMVFKTYFVLKHKHLNYKQLSQATGLSMNAVSIIIKKIKKDLKANLKNYMLNGERVI